MNRTKRLGASTIVSVGVVVLLTLMLSTTPVAADDIVVWDFDEDEEIDRYSFDEVGAQMVSDVPEVSPETVLGSVDDREHIFDDTTDRAPWDEDYGSTVQLTSITQDGGGSICSGTLVSEYHVLTAAHCLGNFSVPEWHDRIEATPGKDVSTGPNYDGVWEEQDVQFWPYATTGVSYARAYTEYTEEEDATYDMALLTLEERIGDNYMEYTGYEIGDSIWDAGTEVDISGYPSTVNQPEDSRSAWGEMWGDDGETTDHFDDFDTAVSYDVDTSGGQSGSAVVHNFGQTGEEIIAVHAYGDTSEPPERNWAPAITTSDDAEFDREGHLDTWISEDINEEKEYSVNPDTEPNIIFDEIHGGPHLPSGTVRTWFPSGDQGANAIPDVFYGAPDEYQEPELSPDSTLPEDETVTIRHDLRNIGTQDREFEVSFYLSEFGTLVAPGDADYVLGTETHDLNPYEADTSTFEDQIPAEVEPGTYNVLQAFEKDSGYIVHNHGELTVVAPAQSELSDVDIAGQGDDAEIVEGNEEDVSVTVQNTGEVDGSFELSLDIGGVVQETDTTGTLGENEEEVVTFEGVTSGLEPDEYSVEISTEDDAVTGDLTVLEPAFFDVNITGTNSPVMENEVVMLNVDVENTGEDPNPETQTVTLTDTGFNGELQDSETFTLEPGESESVTLRWETRTSDSGVGEVTVASENTTDVVNVEVEGLLDRRDVSRGQEHLQRESSRDLRRGEVGERDDLQRDSGRNTDTNRRDRSRDGSGGGR